MILGKDFLDKHKAVIALGNNSITVTIPYTELPKQTGSVTVAKTAKAPAESITRFPVSVSRFRNPYICIFEPLISKGK